jgi:hypothetical protein
MTIRATQLINSLNDLFLKIHQEATKIHNTKIDDLAYEGLENVNFLLLELNMDIKKKLAKDTYTE